MKTVKPQDFERGYQYEQQKLKIKRQQQALRGQRKGKHNIKWEEL